jgi:hypothetical protein
MTGASTPTTGANNELTWRRWKRGGGQYATAGSSGPIYSYVRLSADERTSSGAYQLTDFHWRSGRTARLQSPTQAKALAETWFAHGPPADGFARIRAAWGDWHENVHEGMVGVYVLMPDASTGHWLISTHTYQAAKGDDEMRVPFAELIAPFDEHAATKSV